MPRPRKCRRICSMPQNTEFIPGCKKDCTSCRKQQEEESEVVMTLDEYEIIRLMDLEHMTQEEAARQMNVARTTAQSIYSSARNKLAQFLVKNRVLRIAGGEITVCDQKMECENHSCRKHCKEKEYFV